MFPLQKKHEIWRKVIRVWLLLDYKPTKKRCFLSRFFPTPKHQKDRGWRYYHTLCVLGSGKVVHLCRMWNRRGVSCMTRFRQTTRPVISVCWKLLGGFPGMAGKTIQLEMSKCIVYIVDSILFISEIICQVCDKNDVTSYTRGSLASSIWLQPGNRRRGGH